MAWTLVIVDVTGEDDVDAAALEDWLQQGAILLGEVLLGRVEGGGMEADELPGGVGLLQVMLDPLDEFGGGGGDVIAAVEDEDVGGAVVEGVEPDRGEGRAGGGAEGGLGGLVSAHGGSQGPSPGPLVGTSKKWSGADALGYCARRAATSWLPRAG